MQRVAIILWGILAAQLVLAAPATMPIDTLRERLIGVVIPTEPENRKLLQETARKVAGALKPNGTWPDIDYTNQQRARWPMGNHLQRVLLMAKSQYIARDPALKQKIDLSLNHWFDRDYKNPNWWWNEIGVPQMTGEILILLAPDYTEAQFSKGIEILHGSKWEKWTGQNLVWGVSIQIQRGILQRDEKAIADAYARMFQEVRISSEEGIQQDYSFHQHGHQLYNGGYGLAFSSDVGRQIALSWGMPWQVPPEKLDIYLDYLLKGQSWMMWDNIFDYNAVGRQITRPGTSAVPKTWNASGPVSPVGAAYSLSNTLHLLTQIRELPQHDALIDFENRLRFKPNATPNVGNKYFWRSDYMTHRRTSWFIGLKMLSDRMINAELVNDEGKKSHHLSEGTTYIYRSGEEYRDIFAAWDWRQIPGTTAEQFELQRDGKEIKFADKPPSSAA
jgi:chondroitin AC lyase